MKCPKCGFDQPDDRFCANCGVDVALYVPQKKAFLSFFQSTTFYIVLGTLILAVGVWFLIARRQSVDVQVLGMNRPTSIFKKPGLESRETEDSEAEGAAAPPSATSPPTTQNFQPAPPPLPPQPVLKPKATTFRVGFYEVDLEYVQTLLGVQSDGRMAIGIVRDNFDGKSFADRLKTGTERGTVVRIESGVQTISTDEQTPNTFSFVSVDPRINGEIGLVFQLKAGQLSDTGSIVTVEGRRIIGRADTLQADILNFQQDITIPLKVPAYIVGLARGRNPVDNNELGAFNANPIFRIFGSEKFRNNQSLLVMLIEAVERP